MADGMSFDKYIDNPSGKATVITKRGMYKNMYKEKFDAVLVREQGKIVYKIYKDNDPEDSYYIYMKIPSEVIENFYYDVVIRLHTTVNRKKVSASLREYAVQFFSNDPAFVYTFVHAFSKNKLFINDLAPKMLKQALTNKAVVKNPKDEIWYVKSLYFAYLTMEKYNLFNRSLLNKYASKYSKTALLKEIENASSKIKKRQEEQEKLNDEKRKEKDRLKRKEKRNINISSPMTKFSNKINKTKNSKSTKNTSITKTTKITSMKKKT